MKNLVSALSLFAIIFICSCNKSVTCPDGYTGADCTTQKTPTQIQITKISVNTFPSINPSTGNDWNLTEGTGYADIYPTLSDSAGNTIASFVASYITNASNLSTNSFTPSSPIILTNVQSAYSLTLYNHNNVSADDNMGSATKVLYSSYQGFPSTITLVGSNVTFTLTVKYLW